MSVDPRRRRGRHVLTPENLSTSIQVANLPSDWTQDTVSSVLAGSGPIVDITPKNDPRTGKLTGITYDYKSSRDCKDALDLLIKIENFPCKVEQIIPTNYKERLENKSMYESKPEIELNRDSFPWHLNLELPFQMVTAVPIPRKPIITTTTTNTTSGTSSNNNNDNNNVTFPDIISKASQHLPALKPDVLAMNDPVSQNLSKVPPLQLIEIISNLKILANQPSTKRSQIEKFLTANGDIAIAVSQAMLEMGFTNYNVVTEVIKQNRGPTSNMPSHSNTPNINMNIGMNTNTQPNMMPVPPVPLPAFIPPVSQQQPAPFNFMPNPNPNPNPNMNMNMNMNTQAPAPMSMPMPTPEPVTTSKKIDFDKLQKLPTNQQDMIKQVLQLDQQQLTQLPADQRSMVENLRKEYLI